MVLVRRSYTSPFSELEALRGEMNRLFDSRFNRDEEGLSVDWRPPVDIWEDENSVQLSIDLPGLGKDSFNVDVENNTLTISGERKEPEGNGNNLLRTERAFGNFSRSFSLSNQIDQEKIDAKYTNGTLNIVLHKREESKPKQIEVKVK